MMTTVAHRYEVRGQTVRHVHRVGLLTETSRERGLRLLRALLANLDITQVQLAEDAALTPATVSRMLGGTYKPNERLVQAIVNRTDIRWGLIERVLAGEDPS